VIDNVHSTMTRSSRLPLSQAVAAPEGRSRVGFSLCEAAEQQIIKGAIT